MHRLLQYGLSKQTGKLVYIVDVLRGLKCECICPDCKTPLIARQGKIQWHFAHTNNAECAGAQMTALHLWAQQIIQEEKQIRLPSSFNGHEYKYSRKLIQFDEVFLEKRIPVNDSYIQADCIGRITENGKVHDLLIEIFVTHEVDEQKKKDIKALNLSCIEIDLSDLIDTEYTSEIIRNRLLNTYNDRVWLNSPELKEQYRQKQLKKEKERQELEQKQREETYERRRKAGNFVRPFIYGNNPPTTFIKQFIGQPRDIRDEIINMLESWFYDSFLSQQMMI